MIEARGARVSFYDPFVQMIDDTREHPTLTLAAVLFGLLNQSANTRLF